MLKAHDGNGEENGKREGGRVGMSKRRRRWRWESSNMNDERVDVGSQCHREKKTSRDETRRFFQQGPADILLKKNREREDSIYGWMV